MGILKISCAGTMNRTMPGKYVESILINAMDNAINEAEIKRTKQMLEWGNAKDVVLDSSGFALLQYELAGKEITSDPKKPLKRTDQSMNLAPVHVFEAAAKLKPKIVMALDRPILKIDNPEKGQNEFLSKLGYNIFWARESAHFRKKLCPGVKLYIPVQAYTISQFEEFWQSIKDLDFDGLSMPVRNISVKEIALFMIRFYQIGIKEVHLLGTTSALTIALAAYMARHIFEWVSLDSTSWRIIGQTGNFMNPHDLSSEYLGNVSLDERYQNDCPCPFCNGKSFADIRFLPDIEKTYFLVAHNFRVIELFAKDVYERCDNVVNLKSLLISRFKSKKHKQIEDLCKLLSIVKVYKDLDIKTVERLLQLID